VCGDVIIVGNEDAESGVGEVMELGQNFFNSSDRHRTLENGEQLVSCPSPDPVRAG
jgi:hypothetical protein